MGLFSWLFPSPSDRIAKAEKLLASGQAAEAREQVADLDQPEARALIARCERELAVLNLDAAVSWARAGDDERIQVHLELAETFHQPDQTDLLRETRRTIREIRSEQDAADRRAREERDARLLQVDPLGLTGGPSLLRPPLPDDIAAEDAEELAARLDLILEGYPEVLRDTLASLDGEFARAILDLEEGRADRALPGLLALAEDHPLVCWETARAAHALGDPRAAARTLKRFEALAGGHHPMGRVHSAVFLAQLLAESGEIEGALQVLRTERRRDPDLGGFLYAQLLTHSDQLPEAERVCRELIQKNGKFLPLYALLAQIRLLGGHRVAAMNALERAMAQTCGTPGACGYMPPDPQIVRTLSRLYLEDGIETSRALELADQAGQMVQKPGWEDTYVAAMAARVRGAPNAGELVAAAWAGVDTEDPRHPLLTANLPH